MKSFIFTWNPLKWDWVDLADSISKLNNKGYYLGRWSCASFRKIHIGDRVFLMKLGNDPKGIMGTGYVKSNSYLAPHWDGTENKLTHYVDIEFDILLNPSTSPLLMLESLRIIDNLNVQQWLPQQSGIELNNKITDKLEDIWFEHVKRHLLIPDTFITNDNFHLYTSIYKEGESRDVVQTKYERNPLARKECLLIHGYSCAVCGFNFEKIYGDIGKIGRAHV